MSFAARRAALRSPAAPAPVEAPAFEVEAPAPVSDAPGVDELARAMTDEMNTHYQRELTGLHEAETPVEVAIAQRPLPQPAGAPAAPVRREPGAVGRTMPPGGGHLPGGAGQGRGARRAGATSRVPPDGPPPGRVAVARGGDPVAGVVIHRFTTRPLGLMPGGDVRGCGFPSPNSPWPNGNILCTHCDHYFPASQFTSGGS